MNSKFKTAAPEGKRFKEAGDGRAADVLHQESTKMADKTRDQAMAQRKNVILDSTLGNAENALRLIKRAQKLGYSVRLVGVTADPQLSVRRAMIRGPMANRYVPPDALWKAHQGFNAAIPDYLSAVDEAMILENSGDGPIQIAQKGHDGLIDITDPEQYAKINNRGSYEQAK